MDAAQDAAYSIEETLEDVITQRPLATVGLALALGFLIGVDVAPVTTLACDGLRADQFLEFEQRRGCAAGCFVSINLNGAPDVSAHDQ